MHRGAIYDRPPPPLLSPPPPHQGAVAAAVLARRGMPQQSIIMLATGLVLGEGCMALVTATLASLGARPASCGGCAPGLCGNFCS